MTKFVLKAIVLAVPIAALAQQSPLTIPRDQAECLAQIADVETLIRTDPVLLRLKTCPDIVAGARDLMESSRNTSPGIITPRTGTGADVLILTRREVVCMIDQIRRATTATPDADPVTVDMSRCSGL